ncbi:unnamed protein product, partial [Medioppia subpectinata]
DVAIDEKTRVPDVEYRQICLTDTINDDILTHFPECHQFIGEGQRVGQTVLVHCRLGEGQRVGQTVLVHCRLGISRSATVVISYLMVKYGINSNEAIRRVRKQRPNVKPNPYFKEQLELFGEMGNVFNSMNQKFRRFLLKRWVFVWQKKLLTTQTEADMSIVEKYFNVANPGPQASLGTPYRCRTCSQQLFNEIHVVKDLGLNNSREGQRVGQTVLVHCRLGISRSATVVISYLMVKYGINSNEAIRRVRKQRSNVKPNPYFKEQLELFGEMGNVFNSLNQKFRRFLLKRWVFVWQKKLLTNQTEADMSIVDKYFNIANPGPQASLGTPYRCRTCSQQLFNEIHVVKDLGLNNSRYVCNQIYTEPQQWMSEQIYATTSGHILCPNCIESSHIQWYTSQ